MSASPTAPSPSACLDCGAPLVDRAVAGEAVSECTACGSLRLSRSALNQLRGRSPEEHRLLAASPADPPSHTPPKLGAIRKCPVCQSTVLSHPFGGGNVRVESCESCELVFLQRTRLAAIVKEAREGIQMSDEARATLQHHRLLAAGNRFSAAEFGIGTAILVSALVFFRIVLRTGFATPFIAVGAVVATVLLVYLQAKWRAQRASAAETMDRVAAEELARMREKESAELRALPPKAATPSLPAPAKDSPSRPSDPSKSPARSASTPGARTPSSRSGRSLPCPVCRAPLPAGTTYCKACDSDFG